MGFSNLYMASQVFPGKFSSLEKISDFIVEEAQKTSLDETAVYEVQLAVDEACSNIIEHAYQGEGKGEIICSCEISPNAFTVVLQDEGKPFDPAEIKKLEIGVPLESLGNRGAGVFLMKKLMDKVEFEFLDDKGTILTLVKRF